MRDISEGDWKIQAVENSLSKNEFELLKSKFWYLCNPWMKKNKCLIYDQTCVLRRLNKDIHFFFALLTAAYELGDNSFCWKFWEIEKVNDLWNTLFEIDVYTRPRTQAVCPRTLDIRNLSVCAWDEHLGFPKPIIILTNINEAWY